ncbi:acetyl-CoA synthetase-like protein [Aspergillus floccosus]
MTNGDRTLVVPPHRGDTVLPHVPLFEKLLRYADRSPPRIAIRDLNTGIEKTYLELLTDVLALRNNLQTALGPDVQNQLLANEEVFVALLAPGGYEYAVGFMAILALGAAVVPLSVALPVEEAKSFMIRARCVGIITSSNAASLARSVAGSIRAEAKNRTPCVEISHSPGTLNCSAREIMISSDTELDPNAAALVIFTSGTTGPPKGAVQRRSYITAAAEEVADHYRISEHDCILHLLPVHHVTGVVINFLPYMVSGACVEFRSGSFDAAWTWERWKQGGLSVFSGVPTIYIRMMRHFESQIAHLPLNQQEEYLRGARMFRALLCGTSALPAPVQEFWTKVLNGKRILTRYGATEFGAVCRVDIEPGMTPPNSVGRVPPGVSVKLGEDGMMLVKSPHMFAKYLDDEKATREAHDADGFFRTGDIARKEGDYYFILGRASLDIIKSGGYKISALDIEREILGLEYVSEVIVVGVEDEEFGQRVGAAVSLKDTKNKNLSLSTLRRDLRSKLAGYKMPTLLRVVEGEFPKSATGKVQKKILGPKYFPKNYQGDPAVQLWNSGKNVSSSKL